jgi:hypothetical protein
VLRSGIGENIYLEGEVQAKTLFTAWRRVLIQALDILWSERTKQEKIAVRAEASANLIANLPFDIAEEIRHFMEEDELKNVHLLAMMFPEIANLGKQGDKKWFHDLSENDSKIGPDEVNSASPGSPTSRRRTMSDGQETENMYILDPKAHVNIHNDEKRLKKLLQDFFLKFCKRHPCLLTFENTYGMSSSGLAASSWALFHELIKPFHAVREKIAEEITKSEDILESNVSTSATSEASFDRLSVTNFFAPKKVRPPRPRPLPEVLLHNQRDTQARSRVYRGPRER